MAEIDKGSRRAVAETQRERWIKYGGNVLLVSIVVVVLAAAAIYATERKPYRHDTTAAGLYSLKDQTLHLIKTNTQKIKIVSLYTKAKPGETVRVENGATPIDEAGVVSDLLDEYHSKGTNIEVETIDPVTNPGKVDDLIDEVSNKYGGEVSKYREFSDQVPKKFATIKELANGEAAKLKTLLESGNPGNTQSDFTHIAQSLRAIPRQLEQTEKRVQRALAQRPPDYKGVSDNVSKYMEDVSSEMGGIGEYLTGLKTDTKLSDAVQAYATSSAAQFATMKKAADDLVKQSKGLGELKLDALRDALAQKNPILVRGETEWKVVPYNKVWRFDDRDVRRAPANSSLHPRFAGEQMISTAILALNQPKKLKVAFVRAGGEPMASPQMMMTQRGPSFAGGQFSSIADRLRDYNYDVVDKDVTGMWAMQSQGQGPPEPSDAEIRDAVWVVFAFPTGENPQGGPPPGVSAKLMEHLANGGSALILNDPRGENMTNTLKDWGVEVRRDALCVHELIKGNGAETGMIEEAKKVPYIFEIKDWGNHVITNTMRSLPGVAVGTAPVIITPTKGVTATSIIPLPGEPTNPRCWGETDQESIRQPAGPKFDEGKDMAAPIFAGAAAERDKGRIVVVGTPMFFFPNIIDFPDPELAKRDIMALRFPGNGELFMNSIFWLSRQETMIAISPAAMDVSRLDVTPGAQKFWRVGVLLIGLPLLVLAAGAFMYFSRRD